MHYDFKQHQEKGGHKANEKKMCYENRYNRAKSRIIRAEFIYLGDFNELSHYHKENM